MPPKTYKLKHIENRLENRPENVGWLFNDHCDELKKHKIFEFEFSCQL